jgi:hypothetical protein
MNLNDVLNKALIGIWDDDPHVKEESQAIESSAQTWSVMSGVERLNHMIANTSKWGVGRPENLHEFFAELRTEVHHTFETVENLRNCHRITPAETPLEEAEQLLWLLWLADGLLERLQTGWIDIGELRKRSLVAWVDQPLVNFDYCGTWFDGLEFFYSRIRDALNIQQFWEEVVAKKIEKKGKGDIAYMELCGWMLLQRPEFARKLPKVPGNLEWLQALQRIEDSIVAHFGATIPERRAQSNDPLTEFDPKDVQRVQEAIRNLGTGAKLSQIRQFASMNNEKLGRIVRGLRSHHQGHWNGIVPESENS